MRFKKEKKRLQCVQRLTKGHAGDFDDCIRRMMEGVNIMDTWGILTVMQAERVRKRLEELKRKAGKGETT